MGMRAYKAAGFLLLTLAAGIARSEEAPEAAKSHTAIGRTLPSADVWLRPVVGGMVKTVSVASGQRVDAGAVVLTLDDRAAQARIKRLEVKEKDAEVELEVAKSALITAAEAHRLAEMANRQAAVPYQEVLAAQTGKVRAERDARLAESGMRLAQATLEEARAQLADYRLVAPFAGVVEAVEAAPGVALAAFEPAMRIVRLDPLRVEAYLPAAPEAWLREKLGRPGLPAKVVFEGGEVREGRTLWLSALAQDDNHRTVVLEVANSAEGGQPPRLAGEYVKVQVP